MPNYYGVESLETPVSRSSRLVEEEKETKPTLYELVLYLPDAHDKLNFIVCSW